VDGDDLTFTCFDGRAERHAAVPTILLRLRIEEASGAEVSAIVLRCQLRIESQRRQYGPAEADRLLELFGGTERWGDTLKPLHFANLSVTVPGFEGATEIDIHVPCTYDFDVVASKYLNALDDGEVPLLLLFSGTMFTRTETGYSVTPVPWHKEASYRLPARVWREMMNEYFPNEGWIRIRRETIDALQHYKARNAMTSWEEALESLLATARDGAGV